MKTQFDLPLEVPISGLFESIRGFKYSFHEAIADIVDNSVDAKATVIHIYIDKDEGIQIVDDGEGMNEDDLKGAITPWRNAGHKSAKKGQKGKYGVGLKSAGFSLGDIICIHTRRRGGTFYYVEMPLESLRKKSKDNLIKVSIEPTELWNQTGLTNGTIIEIRQVNKRKVRADLIDSLRNRLGLSFYGMLERDELVIMIDRAPVDPINPLLPELQKNSRLNYYHSYSLKEIEIEDDDGSKVIFKVSAAHLGRGGHWSEKERKNLRMFLKSASPQFGGAQLKIQEQGLYISRNGRLITQGGWYGTRAFSHHHSPCRILIEFSDDGDNLMGVDHTKTKPEIQDHVTAKLNQQYINQIFSDSEDRYRDEGTEFKRQWQKKKADEELKKSGKGKPSPADLRMDRDNKISNAIPGYDDKQKGIEDDLKEDLEDEWWMIVDHLPYDCLWAPMVNKEGEVTVLFNENHPGYSALFYEDDEDKVRQNLNNFFYTLSTYEAHFGELTRRLDNELKDELKRQLAAYRRYVSKEFREFE
ncbi:MAG: ATP-binding protein [Bdellovibrionaceae bacterium]|nr:ATP-binding protein [Pseudobdellovibrionaceae bacterium]